MNNVLTRRFGAASRALGRWFSRSFSGDSFLVLRIFCFLQIFQNIVKIRPVWAGIALAGYKDTSLSVSAGVVVWVKPSTSAAAFFFHPLPPDLYVIQRKMRMPHHFRGTASAFNSLIGTAFRMNRGETIPSECLCKEFAHKLRVHYSEKRFQRFLCNSPVSYTHLTLPTILLV